MHQTDSPCLRQPGAYPHSLACWGILLPKWAIARGCKVQMEAAGCVNWPENCCSDVCSVLPGDICRVYACRCSACLRIGCHGQASKLSMRCNIYPAPPYRQTKAIASKEASRASSLPSLRTLASNGTAPAATASLLMLALSAAVACSSTMFE